MFVPEDIFKIRHCSFVAARGNSRGGVLDDKMRFKRQNGSISEMEEERLKKCMRR
jgi:hypothetical protein